MILPLQTIANALVQDSTLATLMGTTAPNKQIFTSSVDIVRETQTSFQYPMLIISPVSDMFEVMPLNARKMTFQVDIFDRTSELECIQIYEQVCNDLKFVSSVNQGTKIWWTRPDAGQDVQEAEMRIWHIRMDGVCYYFDNENE